MVINTFIYIRKNLEKRLQFRKKLTKNCIQKLFVGIVYAQHTSVKVGAVQVVYRSLGALLVSKLTESETLGSVGVSIVYQTHVVDRADGAEVVSQVALGGLVWDVAN